MSRECLPEPLRDQRHTDWIWPFSYIPRAWTSFCHGRFSVPPIRRLGNTPLTGWRDTTFLYPKPIPPPGHWHLASPLYFAFTTKRGLHFRIGARFDDVDGYYTIPSLTLKKVLA